MQTTFKTIKQTVKVNIYFTVNHKRLQQSKTFSIRLSFKDYLI